MMGLIFAKLWSLFCNQGMYKSVLMITKKQVISFSHVVLGRLYGKSSVSYKTARWRTSSQTASLNAEHKVIIVGLDNAGKTTILYQFLMNEVVHTSPTIGSNVEEIVVKNTHFLMWDIGGQESLRSSWNTYYSNTEFIILVVDSIDRERLAITKEELYRMLAHEDLRKAAVLIFANKQDMKGCMTAAEISKYLTLSSIKDHPWHIQSCCALTGEGLCQGLEWMTSRIGVR
ncbi:ADP-ribosylation factor-like protein 5B isoform X1 [Mustela erminea]|nr:ADP-ribosylation factor-like protein 5B isoform X1 [Mustela erminea]